MVKGKVIENSKVSTQNVEEKKRYYVTFTGDGKYPEYFQSRTGKTEFRKSDFMKISLTKKEIESLNSIKFIKIKEEK